MASFQDRGGAEPAHGHKRFYTVEQIGEKRSFTPEGFLLCEDVPIARIGTQLYGEHELPGLKGVDGLIRIHRNEDEVFKPAAVLSFSGKPVTNDHPPEKVTPDNWHDYSVGSVINPRRGDGLMYDNSFLYADLLITSRKAIQDILEGKREVSAGYDAEYEQTTDGEGRQYQIIGNHVALVKRGRCGPTCHIGDEDMAKVMNRRSFADRILTAFRSNDEGALVEELEKVGEMLGEPVSGKETSEGGGGDTRDRVIRDDGHVAIHLHSGGGGGVSTAQDEPDIGGDPANGGGNDPDNGGSGGLAEINARLERIEQAIMILAQGDDDDGDENGNDLGGDPNDDGFHDEAATEPDSDEPELKPDNSMPYGAGSRATGFSSGQMGTADRKNQRRRTADQRRRTTDQMTADAEGEGARTRAFVGDSSSMQQEFNETVARAEMLVAGAKLPTFDSKSPARITFDTLCALRRNTLAAAYHDQNKRPYIELMLGGRQPDFKTMTCDNALAVFNGASELVRQETNQTVGRGPRTTGRAYAGTLSPAQINEANRKRYQLN
jgi:uncharacterized protein